MEPEGGFVLFLGLFFALMALPFWESSSPEEWTDEQIAILLRESPWVSPQEGAHIYLASAKPIREAELERWRRRRDAAEGTTEFAESDEYIDFLLENGGDYTVLAVHIPFPRYLLGEKDTKAMEKKCVLMIGKTKHSLVGHFPPMPWDPYLRLVFPKVVPPDIKEFSFMLYVPGVPKPYREVIFKPSELTYRGNPEW
jgi:hypothetical protein